MLSRLEKFAEKWWGMLILVSIPIFVLLWPVVFGFRVFSDLDVLERLYPMYSFYQEALQNSQSIFWTPYGFSGFPLFAGPNGFFSPLTYLLFKTFSFISAYHLLIFVSAVLAAFLTALFLKELKVPIWGAFVGGLAFVFSQWRMIHDLTISTLMFLPLLFLLLWQMREKIKARWVFLGILAIGLGWLISNWDYFIRILFSAGFFALYLGFLEKKYLKFLLIFVLMVFGGALLASIQLLPAYTLIQLSAAKAEGIGHWLAVKEGLRIGDLAKLFLPYFDAPLLPLSLERLYIGVLPLFLFLYGFTLRSKKIIGFFSFLFLLSLLLSINNSSLFWLIHHLPPFNFIHYSFRWMMVGSFAMAVLAGLGIKKLSEAPLENRGGFLTGLFKWSSIVIVSVSAVFSLIVYFAEDKILAFLNSYFLKNIYPKTSGLPLDYYYDYLAGIFFQFKSLLYLLSPRVFVPIIFLTTGYFLFNRFFQGKLGKENFIRLAAFFVALNFVLVFAFENNTFSRKIFDREPETVKFLKTREQGRILPFLGKMAEFREVEAPFKGKIPEGELFRFKSEMLLPNLNFQYKIASAALYEPLMTKEMAKLLALVGTDRVEKFESLADEDISLEEKTKKLSARKNILDFLGVRYIISTYQLDEKVFPKIFETRATSLEVPVYIYENKSARPLYYFAKEISDKIEEVDFQGREGVRLLERKNNLLVLEIELKESRYLIFSQNNFPGWKAYLDNKEAAIYDVARVYMAVLVPEGRHKISFHYSYKNLMQEIASKYGI